MATESDSTVSITEFRYTSTSRQDRSNLLEQDEQVVWVGRSRHETIPLVKGSRVVVLRMHSERADASDLGGVERPEHGIFEQPRAESLALPARGDRQTREQHQRNRVPRESLFESFGRGVVLDLRHHKRVEACNLVAHERHVGL